MSLYLASVSVVTTVKWFWFVIAAILLVCVIAAFARGFKESANLRGPDVSSLYGQLAALVMICFVFYPVCCPAMVALRSNAHASTHDATAPRGLGYYVAGERRV